jgi:hypothetical protein
MGVLSAADVSYMQAVIAEMMPDTCSILSEALASDGQGGQTSTWGTVATNVPCRFDEQSARGINQITEVSGLGLREAHRYILSLPHDTAIGAHDRVEMSGSTYSVISVNVDVSWQAVTRAVLELI